jgi:hemolysin III
VSSTAAEAIRPARPRFRGVLHQFGFIAACSVGVVFVAAADGPRVPAAAVFAVSVAVMLGVSAAYHRITWKSPRAYWRMRRADHAAIYLLIAGTYTPVGLLVLHGPLQIVLLAGVWAGAAAAIVTNLCWIRAPKWLAAVFALALGWVGVAAVVQLFDAAGLAAVVLLAAGGLAYSAGAGVYVRRRPDPFPAVFGYHEVFHALTLVALACQYVGIAFFVVRVA